MLHDARATRDGSKIIDIGTGSGCIAITLAVELPQAKLFATDVSARALEVATANAQKFSANVTFIHNNILTQKLPFTVDVIVSNPPYIARGERNVLPANVVDYEPELALFVDSNDPLLFYRMLLSRAKESLNRSGTLAVEVNERFGRETFELFREQSFKDVELIRDVYGKNRIVKGVLS